MSTDTRARVYTCSAVDLLYTTSSSAPTTEMRQSILPKLSSVPASPSCKKLNVASSKCCSSYTYTHILRTRVSWLENAYICRLSNRGTRNPSHSPSKRCTGASCAGKRHPCPGKRWPWLLLLVATSVASPGSGDEDAKRVVDDLLHAVLSTNLLLCSPHTPHTAADACAGSCRYGGTAGRYTATPRVNTTAHPSVRCAIPRRQGDTRTRLSIC